MIELTEKPSQRGSTAGYYIRAERKYCHPLNQGNSSEEEVVGQLK